MSKEESVVSAYHVSLFDSCSSQALLDDITLDICRGDWNEFVSPPSSGKSLLFSILSLRQQPAQGHLLVQGRNLSRLSSGAFAQVRQGVGSCAQRPCLLDDRTTVENLVVPLLVRGTVDGAREKADKLLDRAGLLSLRNRQAGRLNERERRLVGALRAMIDSPPIILLDGVLEEVDAESQASLLEILGECHSDGSTIFLFGRAVISNERNHRLFQLRHGTLAAPTPTPTVQPRTPERGGRLR
jgi:ABC-type ATPase involved in cell division